MGNCGTFAAYKSIVSKILFRYYDKHVAQFTFHYFRVICAASWLKMIMCLSSKIPQPPGNYFCTASWGKTVVKSPPAAGPQFSFSPTPTATSELQLGQVVKRGNRLAKQWMKDEEHTHR